MKSLTCLKTEQNTDSQHTAHHQTLKILLKTNYKNYLCLFYVNNKKLKHT
jgi:hypothetical protein